MCQLLLDILAGDYDVTALVRSARVADIDAVAPDLLLVGPSEGGGLKSDELVALAARHVRLRAVPVVVLSADPELLQHAGRLSHFAGVSLVSLPFDVDTLRSAVSSVSGVGRPAQPRSSRLPDLCAHGFDVASGRCRRCG
jgi:hypothetical protein